MRSISVRRNLVWIFFFLLVFRCFSCVWIECRGVCESAFVCGLVAGGAVVAFAALVFILVVFPLLLGVTLPSGVVIRGLVALRERSNWGYLAIFGC